MKEFKIKFANDVKGNGPDDFITFVSKGTTKIINESVLEELKTGKEIRIGVVVGHGMDASYSYGKNDLEPEYIETEVIIETKTRKFRQSKK
jgi:hypothetical protein